MSQLAFDWLASVDGSRSLFCCCFVGSRFRSLFLVFTCFWQVNTTREYLTGIYGKSDTRHMLLRRCALEIWTYSIIGKPRRSGRLNFLKCISSIYIYMAVITVDLSVYFNSSPMRNVYTIEARLASVRVSDVWVMHVFKWVIEPSIVTERIMYWYKSYRETCNSAICPYSTSVLLKWAFS